MQAIAEPIAMTTTQIEANAIAIEGLRQAISDIVQRVILPMAERIDVQTERIDQIESSLEKASQILTLVSGLAERNVRDIARAEKVLAETTERLEDTRSVVSQNAELFRLMLDENRADRSEWRRRLERLEQAA